MKVYKYCHFYNSQTSLLVQLLVGGEDMADLGSMVGVVAVELQVHRMIPSCGHCYFKEELMAFVNIAMGICLTSK